MSAAAPWHAHIYYSGTEQAEAAALRDRFQALTGPSSEPKIRFVGQMTDRPVGPHPIPQFELHFAEADRLAVVALIEATALRALIHPLTDDDLADHTTLGQWIGEPLDLDTSVLDPPGVNQGMERFGRSDF